MTPTENATATVASTEEIQQGWHDLTLRVRQLEAERAVLEQENKTLRVLVERTIEHRQKSHGELVLLLSGLVSKLPISDIGVMVSKLVEHNRNVSEVCAALTKGTVGAALPQPSLLKAMDQTKRDLVAALQPAVEELIRLDSPLESDLLRSVIKQPELFFSPNVIRANRCFLKGQVTRERIVREFGEPALVCFADMTTDPKLNPRPKPEEIVLSFKSDFEALVEAAASLTPENRTALRALHQRVQRSRAATEAARSQKIAFTKLSFVLELLHYYENQNTEAPDVAFAQRLPALIEQLVIAGTQETLDEKLIVQAETLMAFVVSADHRLMIVNNVGKGGGDGKILKYVLRLRPEKLDEQNQIIQNEVIPEFVRLLIPPPPQKTPSPQTLAARLRLIHPDLHRPVVRAIMALDRIRKEDAAALGLALAKELGLSGFEEELKVREMASPADDSQPAWEKIKGLVASRADPAAIAAAIRNRLHAKYDADEIKLSWLTLIEADAVTLIRAFCQLPYLPDGSTDPIAPAVMQTYASRLTHEKYAATYHKVVNSLRNMFKANPHSPTLVNFLAMVKWVDLEAANKLSLDIGMPATS